MKLTSARGLAACGLLAMLVMATQLQAQLPAPPDGIVFRGPFVDVDGVVTDTNVEQPDSLQFREPFVDSEGVVSDTAVAAPPGLEYRSVFVDFEGNVILTDVAPTSGLEFREVFVDVEGNILITDIAPPQGLEYREPFVYSEGGISGVAIPGSPPAGRLLHLSGVVPNPFNPGTQISFRLREAALVTATVLDLQGRVVRTLQRGWLPADLHVLRWDGRDDDQRPAASGVYMFRIRAGDETLQATGVLLK